MPFTGAIENNLHFHSGVSFNITLRKVKKIFIDTFRNDICTLVQKPCINKASVPIRAYIVF